MSDLFRIRAKSIHYCNIFHPLHWSVDGSKRWSFTAEIDPTEAEALGLPMSENKWIYSDHQVKTIHLSRKKPFPVFGISPEFIRVADSMHLPMDGLIIGAEVEILGAKEKMPFEFKGKSTVLIPIAVRIITQPQIPSFEDYCAMITSMSEK